MGHKALLASCSLRQQALDFSGNRDRIIASIREAKERGARFRVGPELEVSGYGCWDHFLENETYLRSWQVIADIVKSGVTSDILCDVGMPIVHRNVRYNCRILILDGKIIFIRPKMVLADSGSYHESRYFARWPRATKRLDEYHLPRMLRDLTGEDVVPFGEAVLSTRDTCIGFEICEEFFVSNAPHTTMALAGVEIFSNGSASHHEIGKFRRKCRMLLSSMSRAGGIYLYSNALGCDGDRLYHDGGSVILQNDRILQIGGLYSMKDVEVIISVVDLESVRTFRGAIQSMGGQAQYATWDYPRIRLNFNLSDKAVTSQSSLSSSGASTPRTTSSYHGLMNNEREVDSNIPSEGEEMLLAPALWLFDYLRLSKSSGFFLPLSGGSDSACVALIVYQLALQLSNNVLIPTVENFITNNLNLPLASTAEEICNRLLLTCYMGTENSSKDSYQRAMDLANAINSRHLTFSFDSIVSSVVQVLKVALGGYQLAFGSSSGPSDVPLQNIQARLRMVLGYAIAQLSPYALSDRPNGQLLVLATGNASETLTGYFTKYDSSSGDINPIGSLDKQQIRNILQHGSSRFPYLKEAIHSILNATPSAELLPSTHSQSDEADIGISYESLQILGHLREIHRCGPNDMLSQLNDDVNPTDNDSVDLAKKFFTRYINNRHKAATLPPSFHSSAASPDDNRHDLRPLLYPSSWIQFDNYPPEELAEDC